MNPMSPSASDAAERSAWNISADARDGFAARVREVWQYRRILWFFALRATQSLYRKTFLGVWWLFIRTLMPLVVGSFVFGAVINVPSGGVPYLVFFLAGQLPWNFFDGPLVRASRGIDGNRQLLTKLYIPRIILPLGQMAAGVVEPIIIAVILVVTLVYYRRVDGVWYVQPGLRLMAAFAAVLVILWFAFALSLFTSVWQGRARDMRFVLRHIVGFWLFLTPVVYPASQVSARIRWLIYLNPLTAPVETFKWAVLPGMEHSWPWFIYSVGLTAVLFVAGLWYFARSEGATMDKL
jgi:lipopolysaccharide transport system permease protein